MSYPKNFPIRSAMQTEKDRLKYIERQERAAMEKQRAMKGQRPSRLIVDEVAHFDEMSKKMRELGQSLTRVGGAAQETHEQLSRRLLELERQLAKIDADRKAEDERELREGIEYVKKSLGIIE